VYLGILLKWQNEILSKQCPVTNSYNFQFSELSQVKKSIISSPAG
jgi:hypothetical protein